MENYEAFTVYDNASQYTHTFDIGELSFENDFVNLSVFKVIGLTPTLETEILTDNAIQTNLDWIELEKKRYQVKKEVVRWCVFVSVKKSFCPVLM